MKILLVFLPLLGLVAAQMNGHMNGQVATGQQNRDPFFNDFGPGTGSKPAAPWAAPPQQAGHGNFGSNTVHSPSSTKPPGHNPVPVGGPQVANNNPYANADPNAGGGNSGGLTGFGEADVFHAVLNGQQPLPAGGAGPVNGGNGQSSGEQNAGGGGGGIPFGPGLIAGGDFNANDMQKKSDANEVYSTAASASTVVGVVVAVLIVIGIFALVAVFLVRQRRQSRVVIGSV